MQSLTPLLAALLLAAAPLFAEVKLEIGPDTTVIDGPVNPDGTINYLAYLNQKLSEGVTPENNFAVDVMMSMPDDAWPSDTYRQKVLKELGINAQRDGKLFWGFHQYLQSIGETDVNVDETVKHATTHQPWGDEYPLVKQWLDNQAEVIDGLIEATRKPKFCFPFLPEDGMPDMMASCPFPWLANGRGIAWALGARAQWRIGQGDLDGAWSDTLALRRMARLNMNQGLSLLWIVGVSIEEYANHAVPFFVSSSKLTPEMARRMLNDLGKLQPPTRLLETYHDDWRLGSLDLLMHFWKGRLGYFGESDYMDKRAISLINSKDFDPNIAMREVNKDIDRLIEASRIEDYLQRQVALIRYEDDQDAIRLQAIAVLDNEADVTDEMDERIRSSNVTTAVATALFLCPNKIITCSRLDQIQCRYDMQLALAPVALAIGGYHAEHGAYPPDLHALVPAYLDSLPTDFATGELPVYKVEGGAAIVYSLGTDLEDDGGVDDLNEGDIVFRIQR